MNSKSDLAKALNLKGSILLDEKKYAQALECFKEAFELYSSINDYAGKADTLNNMGLVFAQSKDHDRAFDLYIEALNIVKNKTYNQSQIANITANIAYSYYQTGDPEKAVTFWKNAIEDFVKFSASLDKINKVLTNILLASKYEDWSSLKRFLFKIFSNRSITSSKEIKIASTCQKDSIEKGKQFYSCKVFIDNDPLVLDDLSIVIYRLHPTFPVQYQQPFLFSLEKNDFPIFLKCWGSFDIDTLIIFRNNSCIEYSFYLNVHCT